MVLAGMAQDRAALGATGPGVLASQVVLNVQVPYSTVLELSREPGVLDGFGPVSAEHVRLMRPTVFRRVIVDGRSGRPVAIDDRLTPAARDGRGGPDRAGQRAQVRAMVEPLVVVDADEPQHDPSARLARLVDVRDVRCCGPGCSMTRTHRDHLEPYPVGATSARNLGRASARCHRAKHAGWTLRRHPDGSVTWLSPLGRTYHRPSPHVPPPRVSPYEESPPLRDVPTPRAEIPWAPKTTTSEAQGSTEAPGAGGLSDTGGADDPDDRDEPPPF